jgi:hypothetical protein
MNFNEVVAEIVQNQPIFENTPWTASPHRAFCKGRAASSRKRFALRTSKAYHPLLPQIVSGAERSSATTRPNSWPM